MTLATIGVRHWAHAMWQRTIGVARLEVASLWPGRLRASLPIVSSGPDWRSVLDMTLSVEAVDADGTSVRRHVPHRVAMSEAARYPHPVPHDVPGARSGDIIGTPGWVRPRERARRQELARTHVVPGRTLDPQALAPVLQRYQATPPATTRGGRTIAVDPSAPADDVDARATLAARALRDGVEWPRLLARRAADRVTALPVTAGMRRVDRTSLESRLAGAFVRALDATVQGARADAVVLRDSAERSAHARTSASVPVGDKAPPDSDVPSGVSHLVRADDVHDSSRRARSGRPEPGASAEHATTLRGATPDVAPLHPLGFPSPWSAPAPDAAISVVTGPAGSASRVVPPTGVPSLPPLMPAAVTQPPALGISAPGLRLATRSEDADVDDGDTTRLADRIRGILRDEARRHGITLQ